MAKKVALVTGAYRGIGFEVVRELAQKGFAVYLSARNLQKAQEAATKLASAAVQPLELDVCNYQSIAAAVREITAKDGKLDLLVNNAGILVGKDDSVLEVPAEMLVRHFETNTIAPLVVTQAFLPLLKAAGAARVINVSSGAGQLSAMENWAPAYAISKTALNAVTRQLAAALAPEKIPVNSMCPGWVRTEMGGTNAPRTVEQGADTIVWLATEAPQDLSGKFLRDREELSW